MSRGRKCTHGTEGTEGKVLNFTIKSDNCRWLQCKSAGLHEQRPS